MKKALAFILCVMLIALTFASCAEENNGDTSSQSVQSEASKTEVSEDISEESSEESFVPDIYNGNDYDGMTFTVFTTGVGASPVSEFVYNENLSEEQISATVNEAIKARNDKIYETLGVEIKEVYYKSAQRYGKDTLDQIRNHISGAIDDYSLYSVCLYDCATLATEGSLYNLLGIDTINTFNPWWEQYFNESLTIMGQLYFTIGDMAINSMGNVHAIFYNADLINDLGLEDPINLANSGKWTIDKALEYSKALAVDSAEPEGMDYKDEFGWGGQDSDAYYLLYGTGVRPFTTDGEKAVLSVNNETTVTTIEKAKELMQGEWYCRGNDYFNVTSTPMDLLQTAFEEGRCMFFSDSLVRAVSFDMDDQFGILPLPKFNEMQENYYALLSTWSTNAYCIALNLDEEQAEFAAAIMDVIGYYSWSELGDSVCTNYYQKMMKNQKLVREDSEAMLDLIFSTVGCDLAGIFRIGELSGSRSLNSTLTDIVNGVHENFTSAYEKFEPTYQKDLETVMQFFSENK